MIWYPKCFHLNRFFIMYLLTNKSDKIPSKHMGKWKAILIICTMTGEVIITAEINLGKKENGQNMQSVWMTGDMTFIIRFWHLEAGEIQQFWFKTSKSFFLLTFSIFQDMYQIQKIFSSVGKKNFISILCYSINKGCLYKSYFNNRFRLIIWCQYLTSVIFSIKFKFFNMQFHSIHELIII